MDSGAAQSEIWEHIGFLLTFFWKPRDRSVRGGITAEESGEKNKKFHNIGFVWGRKFIGKVACNPTRNGLRAN